MSKLSKNIRKPRFKIGDIVLITYKDDYDTSVCSYRYWRDYLKTGIVKEIVSAPGLERKLGKFNFIINIYFSNFKYLHVFTKIPLVFYIVLY